MLITKTPNETRERKRQIELANAGCHKCPYCGEQMDLSEALNKGYVLNKGISMYTIQRLYKTGFLKSEYKTVSLYRCLTCGAEWESDPY